MRNLLAGLGGAPGVLAAGVVALGLIAAGFWVQSNRQVQETVAPAPVTPAPAAQTPAPAEPTPQETAAAPQAAEAGSDTSSDERTETTAATVPAPAPTFDEVRREADGVTVIAGQGAPGGEIIVLQNGVEIARLRADAGGKFATIAMIPPDGAGHVLTLLQRAEGAEQPSEGEIILAPIAPPVIIADATAPSEEAETGIAETADGTAVLAALEPPANSVGRGSDAATPPAGNTGKTASVAPDTPAREERQEAASETARDFAAATQEETEQATDTAQAPAEAAPSTAETAAPSAEAAGIAAPAQQTADAPSADTTPAPSATAQTARLAPETTGDRAVLAEPSAAQTPPQTDSAAPAPQQTAEAGTPDDDAAAQDAPAITQTAEAPAPAAPILRSTAAGVELLNTPQPEAMDNIAIDTISYSDGGDVQLAGRAQQDTAEVRVYLDNTAIRNLPVDAGGRWRGELPNVDAGIYTLRVDEVGTDGQVTSRVETPFKREARETLAAVTQAAEGPISAITVQEGATLWAIARDRYGDGLLYVRVFEANRDAIRDPDLIYPGQVFDLPD